MDPLPSSKPFQKYSWSVTDKEGECGSFLLGLGVGTGRDDHGMHLLLQLGELNNCASKSCIRSFLPD